MATVAELKAAWLKYLAIKAANAAAWDKVDLAFKRDAPKKA